MCAKGLVGYLMENLKGLSEKHVFTVCSSINVELKRKRLRSVNVIWWQRWDGKSSLVKTRNLISQSLKSGLIGSSVSSGSDVLRN